MTKEDRVYLSHEETVMRFHCLPVEQFNEVMFNEMINQAWKLTLGKYHSIEDDEIHGFAWQAILQTSKAWDGGTKGRYITLFSKVYVNLLSREIRKGFAQKRTPEFALASLDSQVNSNDGAEITLLDLVPDESFDVERDDKFAELHHMLDKTLDPRSLRIVEMYSRGWDCVEIGEELGMTRQYVNKIYHDSLKKVRQAYRELEVIEDLKI